MKYIIKEIAEGLSCWKTPVVAEPLSGGLTNKNFKIKYKNKNYMVRIGEDIPEHGIMRFNELGASIAGYKVGISPQIMHIETGALVMDFIVGKTLESKDIRTNEVLEKILPMLKKCHNDMPQYLTAGLCFWVFQVNRSYGRTLQISNSNYVDILPKIMKMNDDLEKAVGKINLKFGHNDLLAGNFIDSGDKMWLIDWDYAGYNSPLFDLSGLAANNSLSKNQEEWMLENYFEMSVTDELWRQYSAMKCSSMLRETMWSMVSESISNIDFNYKQYTDENITGFEEAYKKFLEL